MQIKIFGVKIFNKQILINGIFALVLLYFVHNLIYSDRLLYYQDTINSLFYQKSPELRLISKDEIFHNLIWQAFFMVLIINNFSGVLAYVVPIAMMVIYFSVVIWVLRFGIALDVFYSSLFGWALEIVAVFYNFISIDHQRKKIREAFEHYLAPEYITQVAADPKKLKLGGEEKELTIMFSDIRSFSTISEKLTAEKLVALLNQFLTPMTNIIMENQGIVDKYIGDAIMAFWGAPLQDKLHAKHAVLSGLKMLKTLEKLNSDWAKNNLPDIKIGIGINTDSVVVGNMGSEKRFNYTVMGDGVNLASRLEGLTRYYHAPLVISEGAKLQVANDFCLRMLDKVAVKGKTQGVKIYQVLGEKSETSKYEELSAQSQKALDAYFSKDWSLAIREFNKLQEYDKSGLAELFLERCAYFAKHPPGKNWDGVWQMQEK